MNIWIINQYAVTPCEAGGTRHYNLGRELVQRGHAVTIVTSNVNYITRKVSHAMSGQVSARAGIDGVSFVWIASPTYQENGVGRIWNMVAFALNAWRAMLREGDPPPDVVLGSSPPMPGALAAALIARSRRIPFVFEVRDLWPQSLVELGNIRPNHPVVRLLEYVETYLYQHAAVVISPLPNAKLHIESRCRREVPIVWLPNGVECRSVPVQQPRANGAVFTVMYAGAHNVANNLEAVLEAAAMLMQEGYAQNIRFRLVGDGPRKRHLVQMAQQRRLQNVSFEEQVPKSEIFPLLRQADAFLMSTRKTQLYRFGVSPNKLHDYMAAARPTIVAMESANNPVAEANAGLAVAPDDPKALAEAIKTLYTMPVAVRNAMGMRGRRYIEAHHDFRTLAVGLENILRQAVEGRSAMAKASAA